MAAQNLPDESSHEAGVVRSPASKQGYAIHLYVASTSMTDCSFCNADGDFLIVPQLGLTHRLLQHHVIPLYAACLCSL